MTTTIDLVKLLPITAIQLPQGYEVVYKDGVGTVFTIPAIAATFQNDLEGMEQYCQGERLIDRSVEKHGTLTLRPKLWAVESSGYIEDIEEIKMNYWFIGIKFPGQTLEDFFKNEAEKIRYGQILTDVEELRGDEQKKIRQGEQGNYLSEAANILITKGRDQKFIEDTLIMLNSNKCDPPMHDFQVTEIAKYAHIKQSVE